MKRRLLSVILILSMVLSMLSAMTLVAVAADDRILYVDADGTVQTAGNVTQVINQTTWDNGWYVVNSSVTISTRITVSGEVHLILADSGGLTASAGVCVSRGSSLTIYGQSVGTGFLTATGGQYQAGIGGDYGQSSGSITINGGTINATGGSGGAGIGGGYNGNGEDITINGGHVTATGGSNGAGIGGGYRSSYSNSAIGNGEYITINNGTVIATGGSEAAGIGGGKDGNGTGITINGGNVTAKGGVDDGESGSGGAGIGGGSGGAVTDGGNGRNITINGGTVNAEGGPSGAGIGGGRAGSSNGINITGGNVTAKGGSGAAGIGGGNGNNGSYTWGGGDGEDINITGGNVTAKGGSGAAGIGSGDGSTVSSGSIDGNVTVRAEGGVSGGVEKEQGIVFEDNDGTVYGDVTIDEDLTIEEGESLSVPGDSTLTNGGGTLTNNGQIYQEGTIDGEITGNDPTLVVFYYDPSDKSTKYWDQAKVWKVTTDGINLNDEWYVVKGAITVNSDITVTGDVNLILADRQSLSVPGGINVTDGGKLTIWGQANQTGSLTVTGSIDDADKIIINGGAVTADNGIAGGSITINGGIVTAAGAQAMEKPKFGGNYTHLILGNAEAPAETTLPVEWKVSNGSKEGDWSWRWVKIQPMDQFQGLAITADPSGVVLDSPESKTVTLTAAMVFTVKGHDTPFDVSSHASWGVSGMDSGFTLAGHILTVNSDAPSGTLKITAAYLDENTECNVSVGRGTTARYYNPTSGQTQTVKALILYEGSTVWSDQDGTGGWYVAKDIVDISDRVTVNGDVHLILEDGCELQANTGITVTDGSSLTIWGQNADYNAEGAGILTADAGSRSGCAGIGGDNHYSNESKGITITINGGKIRANGGNYGAGIGGSDSGYNTPITITINGGNIAANGGNYGAGIGGSYESKGLTITITGGSITATGGSYGAGIGGGSSYEGNGTNITITGGSITANGGSYGAGIGGRNSWGTTNITISGGMVKATGGDGDYDNGGTGIGSSGSEMSEGGGTNITITGGTVEAAGGNGGSYSSGGAGIGGGGSRHYDEGEGGTNITIIGGNITATGGNGGSNGCGGAGIGGSGSCYGEGGGANITINGGNITATGGDGDSGANLGGGAGIGSGGSQDNWGTTNITVTIINGNIMATGGNESAGIGGGYSGDNRGTINITIAISGGTVVAKGGAPARALGVTPEFDGYIHATYGNDQDASETKTFVEYTGQTVDDWPWLWVKIQPMTLVPHIEPQLGSINVDETVQFTVTFTVSLEDGGTPPAIPEPEIITVSVDPEGSAEVGRVGSNQFTLTAKRAGDVTLTFTVGINGQMIPNTSTTVVTISKVETSNDDPKPGSGGSTGGSGARTYPPTVSQSDNGKASVSPSTPKRGDSVTILPTPDEGYEVGNVVVKDNNGNVLEVKDNGDGTFSFTQPTGKVTIEVTFVPKNDGTDSPMPTFSDLDPAAWYREAVDYVTRNGLMNGYGDGTFGPDDTLSRAMLAQILYNAEERPGIDSRDPFTDVLSGAWYADAIEWAAAHNIVVGNGNGSYGPDNPITREQLAVMLYRYEQCNGGGFTEDWMFNLDFTDAADISDWAYEAMCWCNMNGIVAGKGNGILDPKGQATRAEAAAMLMRFLSRLTEKYSSVNCSSVNWRVDCTNPERQAKSSLASS